MNLLRVAVVAAALSSIGPTLAAQPKRGSPLGPEESYTWSIRASHAYELLIAVGDSVDVVLLRDRCGAYSGHGSKGCWDASTVQVVPKWDVVGRGDARVRPLPTGSWRFGPGTAGARLYGVRPGAATVVATLPGGQTVSDSLWVIAAPGATRIVLEPKPTSIVAGDTVRFRVTARDSANNVVAVLPLSRGWNLVGPPDSLGYTPVAFAPWSPDGVLVARLGRLTDSLNLHFVPRPKR
jgi:hypothetical protein